MSKNIVIKDRKKRRILWVTFILSWITLIISSLSQIWWLVFIAIIILAFTSLLVPILLLYSRDKIKIKKNYVYCKSPKTKSMYRSFFKIAKIPVNEIKSIYLNMPRGLIDIYGLNSQKIASVPSLGKLSSKKYFDDVKSTFKQLGINVTDSKETNGCLINQQQNNYIKEDEILVADKKAYKKGLKYLIPFIGLYIIAEITGITVLHYIGYCGVLFVGIIVLMRTDRIRFENGYIYCQSSKLSKYVSFMGKAKLPINEVSSVLLYKSNSELLYLYYIEFLDNNSNKLALVKLNCFTSQEYLIKIKNKFQNLHICTSVKNIPSISNHENDSFSDIPATTIKNEVPIPEPTNFETSTTPDAILTATDTKPKIQVSNNLKEDNDTDVPLTAFTKSTKPNFQKRKFKHKTKNNKKHSNSKSQKQENNISRYIDLN